MTRLIGRRLALGALTLALVSVLVFVIIHNIPGDPIGVLLQTNGSPEARATLEGFYGLDRPLPEQYLTWLGNVAGGDLGVSIFTGEPVGSLLAQRLGRTLLLLFGGLLVAVAVAVPLALVAAARQARKADLAVTTAAIGLQSLPEFWLGLLLVLLFGVELGLLPTSGYVSLGESVLGFLEHSILPMVTVGAIVTGLLVRTLRASLVEELRQDYVTTALALGVPWWRVVAVHVLRNALIPTLTLVGVQIGILLGGAVIVEKVFGYPGMGQLLVSAMSQRDYPLIQGGLLLFATTFVLVNLATDLAAIALDPKNRRTTAS